MVSYLLVDSRRTKFCEVTVSADKARCSWHAVDMAIGWTSPTRPVCTSWSHLGLHFEFL